MGNRASDNDYTILSKLETKYLASLEKRKPWILITMNVIYYYYYLFYTRVLPDDEPHATVIFTLSFSESLLVNYMIDFAGAHLLCKFLTGKWLMIAIFVVIMVINYLIYHRTGKNKQIVENKPKFFNSNKASVVITGTFFLVTTSFLFWMADYLMHVTDQCR